MPQALASAHARASSLIVSIREATEGRVLSKTTMLRCFEIHHVVSSSIDEVHFRIVWW
jgi:hypothetical protein